MFKNLNRYKLIHLILITLSCLTYSSCSVTDSLPEGEKLYIGIDKISYNNIPLPNSKSAKDSVGVITALSDAAHKVKDIIEQKEVNKEKTLSKKQNKKDEKKLDKKAQEQYFQVARNAIENTKEQLNVVLQCPPNNAIFGSSKWRSPLQFGLWFYAGLHNSTSPVGKWLYKVFATMPIMISTVAPQTRCKVAQTTLNNYGFFNSRVNYELVPTNNPKKARISYNVEMGPLYRYDTIKYLNFTPEQDSLLQSQTSHQLIKSGGAFSALNLSHERDRIGNLFRQKGYYFWRNDYTVYKADTIKRKHYAQIHVQPIDAVPEPAKRVWYVGKTYINVQRSLAENVSNQKEIGGMTISFGGKKMPVRYGLWKRNILFHTGDLYNTEKQALTLQKLNLLGFFRQLEMNFVPKDTTSKCDTIDLHVNAVLEKPYSSNLEMNVKFQSNQQAGPGLAYSIDKKNAFGGGEKLSFKIYGSYEWQLSPGSSREKNALNSYQLGSQLSVTFPQIFAPFLTQKQLNVPAETQIAADIDWQKRSKFFTLVSSKLNMTYSWHKYETIMHEFSPITIQYDKIINKSEAFDAVVNANPALYISMRNQFIPSMSYSFTYSSSSKHRNPIWIQVTAKESGNILSGLYAATGKSFYATGKTIMGTPFAQFFKSTVELHTLSKLNRRFQVATRFYAGAIWNYGNSTRAPYSEQFYVGGANSLRGFTARSIGPGSYNAPQSKYSYIDQTGDIKFEADAELRFNLYGPFNGALFMDAGNVWLMKKDPLRPNGEFNLKNLKNIAVSTGFGLRYNLSFLVLRFDVGIALHDPYQTEKIGFYNIPRFKDSLNLHFAIGYPF